jgi:hypothetical protein
MQRVEAMDVMAGFGIGCVFVVFGCRFGKRDWCGLDLVIEMVMR